MPLSIWLGPSLSLVLIRPLSPEPTNMPSTINVVNNQIDADDIDKYREGSQDNLIAHGFDPYKWEEEEHGDEDRTAC